jgi:hypothetical protein
VTVFQTPEQVIVEPDSTAGAQHRSAVHHPSRSSVVAALPRAGRLLAVWRRWRGLLRRPRPQGHEIPVVLVGAPADVRFVLRQIERKTGAAYKVIGVVLDGAVAPADATQGWGEVTPAMCYVGIEELDAAVRDLGAQAVIAAGPLSVGNQCIRDLG